MHAAAAFGVPVVALFGPTHPEHTGPWGSNHCVVQAMRPIEHHAYRSDTAASYMRALSGDAVFDAVAAKLEAMRGAA
jgi:ADP-heptose:LPS heptosyltransferase